MGTTQTAQTHAVFDQTSRLQDVCLSRNHYFPCETTAIFSNMAKLFWILQKYGWNTSADKTNSMYINVLYQTLTTMNDLSIAEEILRKKQSYFHLYIDFHLFKMVEERLK